MLPMTRVDIADYLGLTVETISRTFAELRDDNLIRMVDHGVLILDRRRLEEIATAALVRASFPSGPRPEISLKSDVAFRPCASAARPASR